MVLLACSRMGYVCNPSLHQNYTVAEVLQLLERIAPKKARAPQPKVIAVRVANLVEKDFLLAADKKKFFTEPHYDDFPAVLVRLAAVTAKELEPLIREAWRCQAPRDLVKRHSG